MMSLRLNVRTSQVAASIHHKNRPLKNSKFCSTVVLQNDEYNRTPQYPPVVDVSPEAKRERRKQSEREEIKAVQTVEEKQIKLNMPKYYGFKTYLLPEENISYNNLNLIQHCTRTHLRVNKSLPKSYEAIQVDELNIKSQVEEAILIELDGFRRTHDIQKNDLTEEEKDNIISSALTKQVNRIIMNKLSDMYTHLSDVQVDISPRIESTWVVGGMNPPENIKRYRRGREWTKPTANDPVDRIMRFSGSPNLALRSKLPLLPIIPYSEAENVDFSVPLFQYDPRTVGTKNDYMHIANIPGFWPGDIYEFGLLSYHRRGHILKRSFKNHRDTEELLHGQGILASFGWLSSQANFLGFNTFNDITYPLVTQTVITNGKLWSFYIYQLNTLLLHSDNIKSNLKRNVCWATPELKLYEDISDGKVNGLNEEVLEMLVKLYLNVPQERLGLNLKPYLSQKEKVSAEYEDDEKREWLEREYKFLAAGRQRHKLSYELYHWEKIYKVDHQTRFMEPRRRPFELFEKPYNRKLNERKPRYIPRALRPHLPRHKGRDAKEFFP